MTWPTGLPGSPPASASRSARSAEPRLPETGLRLLLGVLAVGLAVLYVIQAAG